MTREAKIGMLTGLGVIVLIGVLLSEYLGGGPHGVGTGSMMATGRMASLPMGAAYRQEIMQPVGVPSLVRTDGASVAPGAGAASLTAAPVASGTDAGGAPRMDSPSAQVSSGPAINQAVTAVPAGTVAMDAPQQQAGIPTMQMPATGVQTVYVAGQQPQQGVAMAGQNRGTMTVDGPVTAVVEAAQPAPAKAVGQEYVIAAGDNLAKIAKKFYKSSKNSDIARIVAANPGMLKDEKSTLIAGKKLLIPTVVTAVAEATPVAAVPVPGDTVIRKPGTADAGSHGAVVASTKRSGKVYVVQANDTLEKIAKKLGMPVKKIAAANGIKDANSLQVGEKLQVPAA